MPPGSATAAFNRDASNVQYRRRTNRDCRSADWFVGGNFELNEDVVGLGEYGCTLTLLWTDSLPEPEETEDRDDFSARGK